MAGARAHVAPDAGLRSDGTSGNAASSKPFEEVMAHDWTIEPGVEQYYCVYQTLKEDLFISDFRPIAPRGTHHVTLGVVDSGPPDGVIEAGDANAAVPCSGLTLGDRLMYTAAVGTQGFSLPHGIATKIPAGKQMLLSVHVLNTGSQTLSGHTGIEIVRPDPANIHDLAEQIVVENLAIKVEPGHSTQSNTCTVEADGNILALFHHMHKTGVHMKTTVVPVKGEPFALLDADFDFSNQVYKVLDSPVHVQKGDKLTVDCTYDNPGPTTYTFGESTEKNEMCLTFFYRYPAAAERFGCTQ
jgi:hypothetical protein